MIRLNQSFGDLLKESYRAQRIKNIFNPAQDKVFKLSRSRIEAFMKCERCFYLDRRCGTEQPPMYPYTLNNAVDELLKNEFDFYRAEGRKHPYQIEHNIDAIPFAHPDIDKWRASLSGGIKYLHATTNLLIYGGIDDVWINSDGELVIVDYKATSTLKEISIDDRHSYKRQIEIYQWLFRKNGFKVSNTAYFVFCNGDSTLSSFNEAVKFKVSLLPYKGDDAWIEGVIQEIRNCLNSNLIPKPSSECNYCNYWFAVYMHEKKLSAKEVSFLNWISIKTKPLFKFLFKKN